jgi:hypothetical protein
LRDQVIGPPISDSAQRQQTNGDVLDTMRNLPAFEPAAP